MREAIFLAYLFLGVMFVGSAAHLAYFEPLMRSTAVMLFAIGLLCWIVGLVVAVLLGRDRSM